MPKTTVPSHQVLDGSIKNDDIATDAAIAHSKLANVSASSRVLGRKSTGAGAIEELTGSDVTTMLDAASTTVAGKVELATESEVATGSDTSRAVTPAGIAQTIQKGSIVYAADSGSTDAYAITLVPTPSAYTTGMVIHFKANTANTGACTLNVNSLGAKTIKKNYDSDLADGDIKAGQFVSVIYDGTNFQLISPISNVAQSFDEFILNSIEYNTQVLLHFEEANNSTNINDSTYKNIFTTVGNAKISTSAYKFGASSLYCDGVDDAIYCSDSNNFVLGSNDFTIELYFKRDSGDTGLRYLAGQSNSSLTSTTISFRLYLDSNNKCCGGIYASSTAHTITGTTSITDTNWHHLVLERNNNTLTLYVDGVSEGTPIDLSGVTVNDATNNLSVGRLGEYTSNTFKGYIDEFRMVTNCAVYQSAFSVPTSEYSCELSFPLNKKRTAYLKANLSVSGSATRYLPNFNFPVTAGKTYRIKGALIVSLNNYLTTFYVSFPSSTLMWTAYRGIEANSPVIKNLSGTAQTSSYTPTLTTNQSNGLLLEGSIIPDSDGVLKVYITVPTSGTCTIVGSSFVSLEEV